MNNVENGDNNKNGTPILTSGVRHCKKRLRLILQYEEAEQRRNLRNMENHYYECIYDIVKTAT